MKILSITPWFVVFYVLLILPFLNAGGGTRIANVLFWPIAAVLTLTFVYMNKSRIDRGFFWALPILSLAAYLLFAVASVTWALAPAYAFQRVVVQIFAVLLVVLPYALPIRTDYLAPALHVTFVIALVVNAYFVASYPPSPVGHVGYFDHKQELGMFCATGLILSIHELLFRGWRRLLAIVAIGLGLWLLFESESKSALAYSMIAATCAALFLLVGKATRLSPAYIVGAVTIAALFVNDPLPRISYRLYGDATLTHRTEIWRWVDSQISLKPWLGWGFHSYYFVPNSPQYEAPGFIREMPSSHGGFLELKLETGQIGYWIFLVFVYAALHAIERVRRVDPVRAWFYLSISMFAIILNLTDTVWLVLNQLWILYLIVVAETVRFVRATSKATDAQEEKATKPKLSRRTSLGSLPRPNIGRPSGLRRPALARTQQP